MREFVPLVPQPRVHERRMEEQSTGNARTLEPDRILTRVLLASVEVGATLSYRKGKLKIIEEAVTSTRRSSLDVDVVQRYLGSRVAEQEPLDILVALEAVHDPSGSR